MPITQKSSRHALAALLGVACAAGVAMPAQARTKWPNGAKGAIVLTYDDALASQLDHVVPALDAAAFKATFFLSNVRASDVPRWRTVAAAGHELGNHTVFHACSAASFPADPRYTTEAYTIPSMLREIEQQNTLLVALDGKSSHGFATPCGQTQAGGKDYLEALRRSGLVTYVRGVSETSADLSGDVAKLDPMHVPAHGFAEGTTLAQLIDFAKKAEAGGGWAVYLFHGIGGDHLQVSDDVHRQFVAWLAQHRSDLWVTTAQNAIDWAKTHPGAGQ